MSILVSTPNPSKPREVEVLPQFVPNALTDITTKDLHITGVVLTNTSGAAVTVTVQDRQGTPLPLYAAMSLAAGATFSQNFRGRWMPGGVSWQASAGNAVVGTIRGY